MVPGCRRTGPIGLLVQELSLRAFAKLNLALAVAPPERDGPRAGWHRICSWMHAVGLHDDVRVEVDRSLTRPSLDIRWADDGPMHAGGAVGWLAESDLSLRAAMLLGEDAPLRVTVRKRIPDGGGLGGGSSDAAAVLKAGDALLGLGLGPAGLGELSMQLGSDVAFFIDDADPTLDAPPRPAIVSGYGEAIDRLAAPTEHTEVTLAFPDFGCPTGEVYAAFDALDPEALRDTVVKSLAGRSPRVAELFNDLAPAAEQVRPTLADLRTRLRHDWACPVHVTGSGSTLFAIGRHAPMDGCRFVHTLLV